MRKSWTKRRGVDTEEMRWEGKKGGVGDRERHRIQIRSNAEGRVTALGRERSVRCKVPG